MVCMTSPLVSRIGSLNFACQALLRGVFAGSLGGIGVVCTSMVASQMYNAGVARTQEIRDFHTNLEKNWLPLTSHYSFVFHCPLGHLPLDVVKPDGPDLRRRTRHSLPRIGRRDGCQGEQRACLWRLQQLRRGCLGATVISKVLHQED